MGKVYAIKNGRETGLFDSWATCKKHTMGYPNARFKSFERREDAIRYLEDIEYDLFAMDTSDKEIFYVDGSYSKDLDDASFGIVHVKNDVIINEYSSKCNLSKDFIKSKNILGELEGALVALRIIKDLDLDIYQDVYICNDYKGISRFAKGYWSPKTPLTKFYVEVMESVSLSRIKFIKVKAHAGNRFNERADRLAKEALGIS